jgi:hypothetical protein
MLSNTRLILDIIAGHAPRIIRNNPSPRWRYQMACPFPEHNDSTTDGGSFYVDATQQLYRCFGCDAGGNAFQLEQSLGGFRESPPVSLRPQKVTNDTLPQSKKRPPLQGVTIAQLAQAKSLDSDFLKSLGWTDAIYGNTRVIRIPYFDENGKDPLIRYRVGLGQGDRFRWQRFAQGHRLRPYGLWQLQWIHSQGYCFLVEGETDYAALSHRGVAVLGIPGAGNYRPEWTPLLRELQICAWQEPGEAGAKFIQRLRYEFASIEVIAAPEFAKDPCALLGAPWQ